MAVGMAPGLEVIADEDRIEPVVLGANSAMPAAVSSTKAPAAISIITTSTIAR